MTDERMSLREIEEPTKPNGPAAAVILAAGIASFALGLLVTLVEFSVDIKNALQLNAAVGPLSGKTILATIVFLASWGILFYLWRGKEVDFRRTFAATLVLLALGFALTFPPIFQVF